MNNQANSGGGGIYCNEGSNIVLINSSLLKNKAHWGGGIMIRESKPVLKHIIIENNFSQSGGGIYNVLFSVTNLEDVIIKENSANKGGGIHTANSLLIFDPNNRCSIYSNHARLGCDLYQNLALGTPNGTAIHQVYLDTFTVIEPTSYYTLPLESFKLEIKNCVKTLFSDDFFISPSGSDLNSGLSKDEPMFTISLAQSLIYADSLNPRIIHFAKGLYDTSIIGHQFPINGVSYVSIEGAGEDQTILKSDKDNAVISLYGISNFTISRLTVRNGDTGIYSSYSNGILTNLLIKENNASDGGGIFLSYSDLIIKNSVIKNNYAAYYGGGIMCRDHCSPILDSLIIVNNTTVYDGGGIHFFAYVTPVVKNVVIANNKSTYRGGGITCKSSANPIIINATIAYNSIGGINCWDDSHPVLINSILWGNSSHQIQYQDNNPTNSITLFYSDVQGDSNGIYGTNGISHFIEGNINNDPLFSDNTYNLKENSPCIDSGIQNRLLVYNNFKDSIFIDSTGYYGNAPDIGAYEYKTESVIFQDELKPNVYKMYSNFPNPFNPITTIKYDIPKISHVTITIFNIDGQIIDRLVDQKQNAGLYTIMWNASNCSSGVYFYQIKADGFQQVRKCLLIK
ncbi:T9SS type A sorting domain-containing protein [bacterium]|nr:T9SS type A sorting domain-containing protein [bacterium]MBU1064288.1 T9SS type A sorting domain-containing protein [bacterium]MBU1873423.1 T9SS type A sorting domain-containing protein [bacterium]